MGDKTRTHSEEGPERHLPLLALATKQHGIVTTRQLKALGYSRNSASKANGVGRLKRLHRGVYAVGHVDLSWHAQCLAAVLAASSATARSVASHWSAAWIWGLVRSASTRMHVTVPTRRSSKREFAVHFAPLADADVTEVEGIPVTSWARTLLDLAPLVPPARLERFVARADELKLLDLGPLDGLLARTTRHSGHAALGRALAIYRPRARVVRSGVEERFLAAIRATGLPLPATNVFIGGYELDAYWEAERFAVEIDAFATHGSPLSFERDRRREDDLLLAGIETIRVTEERLQREPDAVGARVAAHLRRRRQALGHEPP